MEIETPQPTPRTEKGFKKIQKTVLKFFWILFAILRRNLLAVLTLTSLIAGWLVGLLLVSIRSETSPTSTIKWSIREISYVKFPGEIGENILKGFNLPLFMSCVISSLGSMNMKFGLAILCKTLPIFMLTTYLGLLSAWSFYEMMRPGSKVKGCRDYVDASFPDYLAEDLFYDVTRKWFQGSLVGTMLETPYTELQPPVIVMGNLSTICQTCPLEEHNFKVQYEKMTNYRGLLTFCILFGLATSRAGLYGRPVLTFAHSVAEAMTKLSHWAVWAVPAATVSLVASELVSMSNSSATMGQYKWLLSTHAASVFFFSFVFLPSVYFLLTRKLPFVFMSKVMPAVIIAFATQSSLTAMPIVLQCLDNVGVRPHISRLLVPIMTILAKPADAIYISVDALFVAECHGRGKDLTFYTHFIMSIFAWAEVMCGAELYFGVGLAAQTVFNLDARFVGSARPIDWLVHSIATSGNALNYCFLAVFMDQYFSAQLNLLPPFNQLLREGLILKRLSEVAAQAVDVNERRSRPHILLNHSNAMLAAAQKRKTEKLEKTVQGLQGNDHEKRIKHLHHKLSLKSRPNLH